MWAINEWLIATHLRYNDGKLFARRSILYECIEIPAHRHTIAGEHDDGYHWEVHVIADVFPIKLDVVVEVQRAVVVGAIFQRGKIVLLKFQRRRRRGRPFVDYFDEIVVLSDDLLAVL